ncbi:hypothetical protein GOP47_0009358 [Adiantum capillus-veneris]|uniref:X8 domain-containing protein n=1 Tax=Adiantum capillus-veneris TaxID=13818 RepID=A0A9D4UXM5_ADICA|nr:hypothetical protein GOP47_0009358 [Adiantum capillus-veneris]
MAQLGRLLALAALAVGLLLLNMGSGAAAERWCVARKGQTAEALTEIVVKELCQEGAATSENILHDCGPIVPPAGTCFQPNTPFAHASYVINSSWQRRNSRGENVPCDFNGHAALVFKDPSTSAHCRYPSLP